jgi:mono/diheme cytochrome c family protein
VIMQSKIFLGTVLFIILFVVTGVVLLNEGILPEQQTTPTNPGTGRMQVEQRAILAGSTESGALLFLGSCSTCHGRNGEGVPGKGPVLNPDLFTKHFPQIKSTLGGFGGTVKDFIRLTVAAGRPIESAWAIEQGGFPQRMPTWGKAYGGPLTDQQVENIVNFVTGWENEAVSGGVQPAFQGVGSDLTVELPAGDATHGEQLFAQKVKLASGTNAPCQACHSLVPGEVKTGPSLAGVASRAGSREPGKTADQYVRESIQQPSIYIVSDDPAHNFTAANGKSLMPDGLANQMSPQDLADMIAYLLTLQ